MEKTHRKPRKMSVLRNPLSWNFLEKSLINSSKSIIHSLLRNPSEQMFLELSKRTRVTHFWNDSFLGTRIYTLPLENSPPKEGSKRDTFKSTLTGFTSVWFVYTLPLWNSPPKEGSKRDTFKHNIKKSVS
jgi:hypothetical protein